MKQTLKLIDLADWQSAAQLDELTSWSSVALFVSGGSSVELSMTILEYFKSSDQLNKLTIYQVDERFGPRGHKNANHPSFDDFAESNNINFYRILDSDSSLDESVSDYQAQVSAIIDDPSTFSIAILGMGLDGHTAGILPAEVGLFSERYGTDSLYAGYQGEDFTRITAGYALLRQIDSKLCYVTGQEKIQLAENVQTEQPEPHIHPIIEIFDEIEFVTKKEI